MNTNFIIFISYQLQKEKCPIFNNLRDTAHPKSTKDFFISKSIKDKTFFLFAIDSS